MLAFHNDPAIKRKYLDRVLAHQAADEIIHGKYWENGKGCAVGCTIHSDLHLAFEIELGIPIMLAYLEDRLFEGMSNGRSKEFPARFLRVITPGADLSRVGWNFLHWLLTEELMGRDRELVCDAIKCCANVLVPLTKGEPVNLDEVIIARRRAYDVMSKARNAAAYTAAAAANAAHAVYAAAIAAHAATYAVDAVDAAAAAAVAYAVARREVCDRMADKFIQLLQEAK